mmetsp:Transcript_60964/g.164111  ORF Transcript_60964/g.164111 Transcript_60964/m.164111 type:complete len:106 (+) Transcript_60964:1101-1418(+)
MGLASGTIAARRKQPVLPRQVSATTCAASFGGSPRPSWRSSASWATMWELLRRPRGLTMFDDFQGSCVEAFVQSRPFARAGISACHHTVAGIALDPQFGFSVQSK